MPRFLTLCVALFGVANCAQAVEPMKTAASPFMANPSPATQAAFASQVITAGLDTPWGMAWLPNGDVLITEKGGNIRLVRGGVLAREPVGLVPSVAVIGQGGLMDVAVDPDFTSTGFVFFSYATGSAEANVTRVARARFDGKSFSDWVDIWGNPRTKQGGQHFGSRIAFLPDKTMLVSIGDGGNPPARLDGDLIRKKAQDRAFAFGKILRMDRDGRPPSDNPFATEAGVAAFVWTYGHRNIQGLTVDPATGRVFATEHGARGGDELNHIVKGGNFGWPLVTYSKEYSGPEITTERSRPGMVDPLLVWQASSAPSGLAFSNGGLVSGSLVGRNAQWVGLNAEQKVGDLRVLSIGARVRDIKTGPDGILYGLTDERGSAGRFLKFVPNIPPK